MVKISCVLRIFYKNSTLSHHDRFLQRLQIPYSNYRFFNIRKSGYVLINSCRAISTSKELQKLEQIYNGPSAKYIFYLKFFSLQSCVISSLFIYYIFIVTSLTMTQKCIFAAATSVSFLLTLIAHFIFRKYVISMYYDQQKNNYTAVIYTLFCLKKFITFTPKDVETINFEIMSTVKVKGHPLFFDSQHFTSIDHYKKILGYDKPIDFGKDFGSQLKIKESCEKKS